MQFDDDEEEAEEGGGVSEQEVRLILLQLCLAEGRHHARPSETSHAPRADVVAALIEENASLFSVFFLTRLAAAVDKNGAASWAAAPGSSSEAHLLASFRGCVANDSRDLAHDMPAFAVKSRGGFIAPSPTSALQERHILPHLPLHHISEQTCRRLLARPAVSLPAYQNKTPCSSGCSSAVTCKARQRSSDEDVSDSEASVIARYVTVSFYGPGAAGQVCARMDGLRDLKGRRRSWEAGERDGVLLRPMIRLQLDSQVQFSASALRQQHLARPLVYCILTVWYRSFFFWRHFRFSRTRFPPPRIRTNIDSAVVCRLLCARVSRSAAPRPFPTCGKWSFSLCQWEVSLAAGGTQSVGTPKDVLSGRAVRLVLAV